VEPSVLLALLEQLESREPLESLDHVEHPVIQARKDHKVTPDLLVSQVRLEVQVHKELQGNKEQLEALGLWVQMVMWELRVLLARLEMLDKLAVKVNRDSKDQKVSKGQPDLLDLWDLLVNLVPLVNREIQELLEMQAPLVIRVRQEQRDSLETLGQQVRLVTLDQWDLLGLPAVRDFVVRQDRLVILDHREILVAPDNKDKLDRLVSRVSKVNKVRRVNRDL